MLQRVELVCSCLLLPQFKIKKHQIYLILKLFDSLSFRHKTMQDIAVVYFYFKSTKLCCFISFLENYIL